MPEHGGARRVCKAAALSGLTSFAKYDDGDDGDRYDDERRWEEATAAAALEVKTRVSRTGGRWPRRRKVGVGGGDGGGDEEVRTKVNRIRGEEDGHD